MILVLFDPLCWFPCDDLFCRQLFSVTLFCTELLLVSFLYMFIASLLSLGNLGHVPRSGRHFTRHFTNFTSAQVTSVCQATGMPTTIQIKICMTCKTPRQQKKVPQIRKTMGIINSTVIIIIIYYNEHIATENPNNSRTNNDKSSLSQCLRFIENLAS